MGQYEKDQLNKLPIDEFYKLKIVGGFRKGETDVIFISPSELFKIKEVLK